MRDETTLRSFLEALWAEQAAPPPVNETWPELIARIQRGGNQEVPKSAYFYFWEVLPPLFQWGVFFASAEGREAARLFTRVGGTYVCRQLTWDQTVTFRDLAGIDLPNGTEITMRELTDRELATVLAALRFWQDEMGSHPHAGGGYPEHFGDHEPLDAREIDDLCECLNITQGAKRGS